jgi:hypothetical protein
MGSAAELDVDRARALKTNFDPTAAGDPHADYEPRFDQDCLRGQGADGRGAGALGVNRQLLGAHRQRHRIRPIRTLPIKPTPHRQPARGAVEDAVAVSRSGTDRPCVAFFRPCMPAFGCWSGWDWCSV